MSRRRTKQTYPVVFSREQLSAMPTVRPIFWWLLGGAGLLLLMSRRTAVEQAAEKVVETAIAEGKELIQTLTDVKDRVLIVRGLYAAVDAELPQLPLKSKVIIVAQAITESGWNEGKAAKNGNNWFNIIATPSWPGETWVAVNGDRSYTASTCKSLNRPMSSKDAKGRPYCKIDQKWRKYPTVNAAVADYWAVLGQSRYLPARAALESGDIDTFSAKLREGGYYDAPLEEYRSNLNSLVKSVISRLPS